MREPAAALRFADSGRKSPHPNFGRSKLAPMATNRATKTLEVVEPVGLRVLIRKDEDKKQTKSGIHLPDKMEIPTITGRVVSISAQVQEDKNYPIRRYDRVLFNPKHGIPVDFEGDNRLFVIPVEDIVAVFRREGGGPPEGGASPAGGGE